MRSKKSREPFKAEPSHRVSDAARAAAGVAERQDAHKVRTRRLATLMQEALGAIFAHPDFLRAPLLAEARLTVTEVDLSPDLSYARVYLLPLSASLGSASLGSGANIFWDTARVAELEAELGAVTPRVRHALAERVALKRTPRLDLRYDRHRLEAQAMEEKLAQRSRERSEKEDAEESG